ncbi:hypothetical protein DFO73_109214 [Cytobacillus oceanisediminis]|uniref:DUF192 domain-containing protein n=1 Tax=Cytobacillus oceanisediminis TaxID=665099 RepID=A0A2V2ZRS3_9BACI|nr:DUF192 domain-containing protein [Cytobacillus oceanisediminis]PWW27048.1 hypothetical protein DFO73_109214 [Cytobacillus oceanisediminis]
MLITNLLNLSTKQVIAEEVIAAYTFWKRFKGLMLTKSMPENFALHLSPCPSIHTFFMRYNIDVLYLNDRNEIVGLEENLEPGKAGKRFPEAVSVIELPAGKIKHTSTAAGQAVAFVENNEQY